MISIRPAFHFFWYTSILMASRSQTLSHIYTCLSFIIFMAQMKDFLHRWIYLIEVLCKEVLFPSSCFTRHSTKKWLFCTHSICSYLSWLVLLLLYTNSQALIMMISWAASLRNKIFLCQENLWMDGIGMLITNLRCSILEIKYGKILILK